MNDKSNHYRSTGIYLSTGYQQANVGTGGNGSGGGLGGLGGGVGGDITFPQQHQNLELSVHLMRRMFWEVGVVLRVTHGPLQSNSFGSESQQLNLMVLWNMVVPLDPLERAFQPPLFLPLQGC